MRSTVFDFRMNLEDANFLFFLEESRYQLFEFDFKNKMLVDRKDFSVKSQIRYMSNSGIAEFNSIEDYCQQDNDCLSQSLYYGYFGHISMFNFDITSGDSYKPEFLLRDSQYVDVLKMKGYEFYGFLSNLSKVLVRGYSMKESIVITAQKLKYSIGSKPFVETIFSPVWDRTISYMDISFSEIGIGGEVGLYKLGECLLYPIITTDQTRVIEFWSEKNVTLNDDVFNLVDVAISASMTALDSFVSGGFVSIDYLVENIEFDLEGFTSNFGIMVQTYGNTSPAYGNNMYFEITNQET